MRGHDREPESMFSYVSPEQRIPKEHPLRAIRALEDDVLRDMCREFDRPYAAIGRRSDPVAELLPRPARHSRRVFVTLSSPAERTRGGWEQHLLKPRLMSVIEDRRMIICGSASS